MNNPDPTPPDPTPTAQPFGFLVCDKPYGMTSRDLVNRVQRRMRSASGNRKLKLGHTGTLDPLASGVILVAVGSATRLTPWVLHNQKRYLADFRIGASSASGDLEEPVVEHPELPVPDGEMLRDACQAFVGTIEQTPPSYSAIWVDGERAHQRIRRGEDVEIPKRTVQIDSIDLVAADSSSFTIDVRCGSGTYLRTLGMDIAGRCRTKAVMTKLVRTQVGPYGLTDAIPAVHFDESVSPEPEMDWLGQVKLPIDAISTLIRLPLSAHDSIRVRNGLEVDARELSLDSSVQELVAIGPDQSLVAILRRKRGAWWPYRVFPAPGLN